MTEKVFNIAFDELMKAEGGYINDSKDSGGETKYGVSKKSYPELDIKNITKDQAREIYRNDYWNPCKCDLLPDAISIIVADTAYNSGNDRAIKILQKVLFTTEDGIIGVKTLSMANRSNIKQTVDTYKKYRLDFLKGLNSWARFGDGWTNRINSLHKLAESYF